MNTFDLNRCPNRYVLGFAFPLASLLSVLLISKRKPAWQAGKVNGIGGSVDQDEAWTTAMTREFMEETGVYIAQNQWIEFVVLHGKSESNDGALGNGEPWAVKCFTVLDVAVMKATTKTTEPVGLYHWQLPTFDPGCSPLPNLSWLLPMAALAIRNGGNFHAIVEEGK